MNRFRERSWVYAFYYSNDSRPYVTTRTVVIIIIIVIIRRGGRLNFVSPYVSSEKVVTPAQWESSDRVIRSGSISVACFRFSGAPRLSRCRARRHNVRRYACPPALHPLVDHRTTRPTRRAAFDRPRVTSARPSDAYRREATTTSRRKTRLISFFSTTKF